MMTLKQAVATVKAWKELNRTKGGNLVGIDAGSMTVERKGVTCEDYVADGITIGSIVRSSKDHFKTDRFVTDVVFNSDLVMVYMRVINTDGTLGDVVMNSTAKTTFQLVARDIDAYAKKVDNAPKIAALKEKLAKANDIAARIEEELASLQG